MRRCEKRVAQEAPDALPRAPHLAELWELAELCGVDARVCLAHLAVRKVHGGTCLVHACLAHMLA